MCLYFKMNEKCMTVKPADVKTEMSVMVIQLRLLP